MWWSGIDCDYLSVLTACAPERVFLRFGVVCDEGGFKNSEGPSVSLKKNFKRFLFTVLFPAVPDFVKTNTLKAQTTTIIKETLCGSPLRSKQSWWASHCLNTHCLPGGNCAALPSLITLQVQEEIRGIYLILPSHWLSLKHTTRQVCWICSLNGCLG